MTAPGGPVAADPLAAVGTWPVRAAAGVVRDGAVVATTGPVEETFRWASVTKMLTALAVLVAAEEGTVDLDAPAGPPGATLRHLLSHASGLARDDDRAQTEPGRRRIYSNRGIEVAAETVERSARMPFAEYLTAGVLEPLGMTATTVTGSPASSGAGPLRDLLRLGCELLAPTLVSAALMADATTVAFSNLDGVLPGYGGQSPNDWGLGFEVRDGKTPHWTGRTNSPATFGHFGLSGAFLWVDPVAGIGCAAVSDTDFGPWAVDAWPPLADAVLAAYTLRR